MMKTVYLYTVECNVTGATLFVVRSKRQAVNLAENDPSGRCVWSWRNGERYALLFPVESR